MIRRNSFFLRICLLIGVCVGFVASEDVVLKCDEIVECEEDDYCPEDYLDPECTVTGLRVTHSQHVILDKDDWPTTVSTEYTTIMKFHESSLLYIPQQIFSTFKNLERLEMSSSGIVELRPNTFAAADKLTWLNLSHNNISETTGSVFLGVTKLRQINMGYNRISKLNEHSFSGLKLLEVIYLDHNQIGLIEENIFSDNEFLQTINLEGNQINHLGVGVFGKLKSLRDVNLSNNELTILDPNMFVNSNNIITINVSQNRLRNLHLNVDHQLTTINAKNNEIESISINCTNKDCSSMNFLDLSRNRLNNLNSFTNFPNLRSLSVSNNNIGKVNISTMAKLRNLERLDLKNTSMSGLTFNTFSQQRNLTFLDLSENNLQHLNLDIFLPYLYLRLEELHLDGNNLSEIEGRHSFASFSALKKLGLSGNKFDCSYLLRLISIGNLHSHIEFNPAGSRMTDDDEHIHGIECIRSEEGSRGDISTGRSETSEHLKLLEQLIIIKYFVIFTALLGLCFLGYKGVKKIFVNTKKKSSENKISDRTLNRIQSEVAI